jgi:hypothetical protein
MTTFVTPLVFLLKVVFSLIFRFYFWFPIGRLFVLPCVQCFDQVRLGYYFRVNRVFVLSFLHLSRNAAVSTNQNP